MAHEFHLPDIGEGLTEAVVVRWWVDVGEHVDMDAPLVEIETDKAVVDIPSPHAGVLLHKGGNEGDTIAVGSLLAVVGEPGESWEPHPAGAPEAAGEPAPIVGRLEDAPEVLAPTTDGVRALPRVRRLAAELGIDLASVTGTGPRDRITEDDVRRAVASVGNVHRTRMSPTRRAIAANLSRSWREIPHVTTYAAADASSLLAERERLGKPVLEALLAVRILPLLVEFPDFNAVVEGDDIVHRLDYHLGVAIDTPDGLMVAVVRDAAERQVDELDAEIRRLAAAARERSATADELRGQTFTLSNIGAVGGGYGTPIVPYGTSAILSVGRAEPRPVVVDGELGVAPLMPLSLSYDHRAIDGSTGRGFMARLVEVLEA